MSRPRVVALALAVFAGVNVAALLLGRLTPEPQGPPSSSYATTPLGVAAFAELLERRGVRVRRSRERLDERLPRPGSTLVVVDPGVLGRGDARALAHFAARGGRVVAAGRGAQDLARVLSARAPRLEVRGPRTAAPPGPAAARRIAGVGRVETADGAAWDGAAGGPYTTVLAAPDGRPLLVLARRGRGEVALLADSSPLQNRLLARADNAALALRLAGRGPVTFAEAVHGFEPASGLAALPGRWQVALTGLALAAGVLLAGRARRLGPPEDAARPPAPPRRAYVDALAATLARTRDPVGATAPLREEARTLVARRAALPPDAPAEDVLAAARALGLPPDEVAALAEPPDGQDAVLAGGRALARLTATER